MRVVLLMHQIRRVAHQLVWVDSLLDAAEASARLTEWVVVAPDHTPIARSASKAVNPNAMIVRM
jgi:hypothetical protein